MKTGLTALQAENLCVELVAQGMAALARVAQPDGTFTVYEIGDNYTPAMPTLADTIALRKVELAALRYEKETSGIIVNGVSIRTDRESQGMVAGAWITMQTSPALMLNWKGTNGWVQLNAASVAAIATAVSNHVQACFNSEFVHSSSLDACTTVAAVIAYDITTGWPA